MDYDDVIDRLLRWSRGQDVVRAVVLTGSAAARRDHALSDRDLEFYVTDPAPLLQDDLWWASLGEVLVVERLHAPGWYPSRIVYYVGGKLDLTIIDATEIGNVPRDRPFRVLYDEDGIAENLAVTARDTEPPTAEEFAQALHWGWAAALMQAKAVVRQEPWMATVRDRDLKAQLLKVLEWDHRIRYGAGFDVRHLGVGMNRWMDADVREALHACWARFDSPDTAAALRASTELFARSAERTARAAGFPRFHHERLREELETILATRPRLRPSARALVVDADDRVLLAEHHVEEGLTVWAAPGGGVEEGESPRQALRRELLEEIGLDLDVTGCPHVWHQAQLVETFWPHYDGAENDYFVVRAPPGFSPRGVRDDADLLLENIHAFRWWSAAEITAAMSGTVVFSPRGLAAALPSALAHGVGQDPVDIGS